MPPVIKNVALTGATGNLGASILPALLDAGFNVTILTRSSNTSLPPNTTVEIIDPSSIDSIISALKGHDAFIDASSSPDPALPSRYLDAAVAANIARFIPSEFSADPQDVRARSPLVFAGKNAAFKKMLEYAKQGRVKYTSISNAAFLDWNLRTGFLNIDVLGKKVAWLGDGDAVFPWTLLASVGRAVANALLHAAETENKCLYISSACMSQRQMVRLVKDVVGKEGWEESTEDVDVLLQLATERMGRGDVDLKVVGDMIRWSVVSCGMDRWVEQGKGDNELLAVGGMGEEDVRDVIRAIVKEGKEV